MKKILIIESDVFFGDALALKLRNEGYAVTLSRGGADGLEKMRAERPNLLILALTMPLMSGWEVLQTKEQNPSLSAVPTLAVSDSGDAALINRALALGVKDYLVRSEFSPEDVLAKVRLQLSAPGGPKVTKAKTMEHSELAHDERDGLVGRKVVWVEDDKFLSEIIARKLIAHGCVLFHTADGEEVLRILKKEKPDLVLLDILLSGMDGFEILRRIKEDAETRGTPVILLSNLSKKEDIEKGKALGAARFLVKAMVSLDEIIGEIEAVLREVEK